MWRGGLGAAYLFPALSAPVPHEPDHAPFPHPARQTGRADFPRPAFTLSIWVQALESERLRNFGEGVRPVKAGMFRGRKSRRATDSAKRARRGKPRIRPSECPTSHRASSRPYQVSANTLDPAWDSGEEGWPPGTADSRWDLVFTKPRHCRRPATICFRTPCMSDNPVHKPVR